MSLQLNFKKMFVRQGQILPKGKLVGRVCFDSCFGENFLKISIKNNPNDVEDVTVKEVVKYISSLK